MALELTNIPDRQGPAVYVLGSTLLEDQLKSWCEQLNTVTSTEIQVAYIDFNSEDGAQIAEFYEITPKELPMVMIVMDDDMISKSWSGMDMPPVETVAYELGQIIGNSEA